MIAIVFAPFLFRTWKLDWSQLLGTEDSRAPQILLSLCLDLFETGFISYSLELIAGLSSCHKSARYSNFIFCGCYSHFCEQTAKSV